MKLVLAWVVVVSSVSPLCAQTQTSTQTKSTFTAGLEGWTSTAASVFKHQPTGGKPGGFMYIDNSEGQVCYVFAPNAFHGDLREFDGGAIAFTGMMLGRGGSVWTPNPEDYGNVTISGPGGSATRDLAAFGPPSTTQWTDYVRTLDAAGWGKNQTQWTNILADVTEIRLSVEAMFGAEIQGIDNFIIEKPLAQPTAFCTAKTTLVCGSPTIQWTGTPSTTATSGFVLTVSPAPTCKPGFILYHYLESPGLPLAGGTLCIEPGGLRRGGLLNSGGTPGGGNCDGAFTLDMNAFNQGPLQVLDCFGNPIAGPTAQPDPFLLTPGYNVYLQFYGRDTPTSPYLSGGLAYTSGQ